MRVVLADIRSDRGFVSKDTVVGGYGSRLDPFSRVTSIISYCKKQFHDVPSVHMAYCAAILARAGHEVAWTRGEAVDADVALVLSSIVDHKAERAEKKWAKDHPLLAWAEAVQREEEANERGPEGQNLR